METMNFYREHQAEMSVIGGLLLDFDATKHALLELSPSEFELEELGTAFEAIAGMEQSRRPVDLVTLLEQLPAEQSLKGILSACINATPSLCNYDAYVNIVKARAQKRRMVSILSDLAFGGYETDEMLSRLQGLVEEEQSQDTSLRENMMLYKLAEYRGELYSESAARKISTGFSGLDAKLGQLEKRNFTVIGARPSVGKTAFACCLANNVVEKGKRVVFFSLEMPESQLFNRLASLRLSIDHGRLRDKKLSKDEKEAVIRSLSQMTQDGRLYLFDDVYAIERMERIISKLRPDLVLIDYLQLVTSHIDFRQTLDRVSHVSMACKRIAKRYDTQMVALAQLSRSVEDRKGNVPMLSDLKDCGHIEQDADTVLFLHREYVYDKKASPEKSSVIIAKARHGETGALNFCFTGKYQRFLEVDQHHDSSSYIPRQERFADAGTGSWPPV